MNVASALSCPSSATLGEMAAFSLPAKPGSVMNSPSDAWPLMDLEHRVRDQLEALRAPLPPAGEADEADTPRRDPEG